MSPCLAFHRSAVCLLQQILCCEPSHRPSYKHLTLFLFLETGSHRAQEQAEGQSDLWFNLFCV